MSLAGLAAGLTLVVMLAAREISTLHRGVVIPPTRRWLVALGLATAATVIIVLPRLVELLT